MRLVQAGRINYNPASDLTGNRFPQDPKSDSQSRPELFRAAWILYPAENTLWWTADYPSDANEQKEQKLRGYAREDYDKLVQLSKCYGIFRWFLRRHFRQTHDGKHRKRQLVTNISASIKTLPKPLMHLPEACIPLVSGWLKTSDMWRDRIAYTF